MYRFVSSESREIEVLTHDFLCDRITGKRPWRREKIYPELQDGMSAFGSLDAARAQWELIRQGADKRGQEVMIGHFVAEVALVSDADFEIEDLGEPDEHLTIWGDPARLATAVEHIYPASTPTN